MARRIRRSPQGNLRKGNVGAHFSELSFFYFPTFPNFAFLTSLAFLFLDPYLSWLSLFSIPTRPSFRFLESISFLSFLFLNPCLV